MRMFSSRLTLTAISLYLSELYMLVPAASIRGKRISRAQHESSLNSNAESIYDYTPREAKFVFPSKCIEGCWKGHAHQKTLTPSAPTPETVGSAFVTDFPVVETATSAPTKDMCYGNMARNRKFCNSEMPSVSIEPSEQPTSLPNGSQGGLWKPNAPFSSLPQTLEPTIFPRSSVPSSLQSNNPTPTPKLLFNFAGLDPPPSAYPLWECQGDCDSDNDCSEGLFCYHRDGNEPVPGCLGGENDTSRTDYCTAIVPVPAPVNPPTMDDFCLKMHWELGYFWQEENFVSEWCIGCSNGVCREGETLFLQECTSDAARFVFLDVEADEIQIQAVGTNLCLERFRLVTTLEYCDPANVQQHWTALKGSFTGGPFEITQNFNNEDYCLTTHHHPKYGEAVEFYKCSVARKDDTSLWNRC